MNTVAVIVPVYKEQISQTELLSLNQLYRVLGTHAIFLIGPETLDFTIYVKHARTNGIEINLKTFDPFYFSSIRGYNQLLIAESFYTGFSRYRFILIYQTDAYVFKDELNNWCEKDFDYVGAPWNGTHIYDNEFLVGVGNGGFSLRKTNGALKTLRKLRMLEVLEQYQYFNWKGVIPRLPSILFKLFNASKRQGEFEKTYNFQEDVFWCNSAGKRLNRFTCNASILRLLGRLLIKNQFKIAPVNAAIQFSIETNASELYNLNKRQLPFGCHAWEKYEPEFWKTFIPFN